MVVGKDVKDVERLVVADALDVDLVAQTDVLVVPADAKDAHLVVILVVDIAVDALIVAVAKISAVDVQSTVLDAAVDAVAVALDAEVVDLFVLEDVQDAPVVLEDVLVVRVAMVVIMFVLEIAFLVAPQIVLDVQGVDQVVL